MKKIILIIFLLSISFLHAQQSIVIIGDTTDLKTYPNGGVVLLLHYSHNNMLGGGLFQRIDSTYAEGTNAFDCYWSGLQWARINLVDYYLRASTTNYQVPLWNGTSYYPYTVAGIDSFYTTSVVDTIALSGITSTDKFHFTDYTPTYSTGVDSVRYSYYCKTDTCFVTRSSFTGSFKSGGQFSWIRFK